MPKDWADGMCPNCVTPWKCNGPHLPFYDLTTTKGRINLAMDYSRAVMRVEELTNVLALLMEDTQHLEHECGDTDWCPVYQGRMLLYGHSQEAGTGDPTRAAGDETAPPTAPS